MPAILLASKMKSGLPKPVHSALPIPQVPSRPLTLPLPLPVPLKPSDRHALTVGPQGGLGHHQGVWGAPKTRSAPIYTDWANHYLAKSGHKRFIKDLQTDVTDGVLLAEIIQVVANEKIEDINGCPKSRSQMIENIDACLSFLAAKGVNIQDLSAEEIRNGNLKAILGLFFSLSRYKQQQAHRQYSQPHLNPQPQSPQPPLSQQTSAPAQLSSHPVPSTHETPVPTAQCKRSIALPLRLPGPSARVSTAGSDITPRGSVGAAGNRRSQGFTDKTKPAAYKAAVSTSANSASTSAPVPPASSSAIPHPNSSSKPWRSKSVSSKHTSSSAMLSVKQEKDASSKASSSTEPPPKVVQQKSMLEKLKLFNSKGGSKSSSPKIALRGIAQRTFSRALTAKKSSVKGLEKEKEKERVKEKERGKEAGKHISTTERMELRGEEPKEEATTTVAMETEPSSNKRTSKIASFIPKGSKVAKKESSVPAHSGIPKPGGKTSGVGGKAPLAGGKEGGERPRSMRLGGGLVLHRGHLDKDRDSRHSSSTSSLASTEGKASQQGNSAAPVVEGGSGGTTQSTACNTVSVQLPQPQQHHSHPNTATVAPFMYRSQTDVDGIMATEAGSGGRGGENVLFKTSQPSIEDLSAEDPETRRLRTVKNIADLRQNLEETMSSLRGTQITHSTLETTFDSNVTTEISGGGGGGSGRSILSLTSSRPSLSSWRLGQSSPRLQAGDAPSTGNGYGGRALGGGGGQGGRYLYPGPLRRQLAGRGGALGMDLGERGEDIDLEGIAMEVTGYMSDGDVLSKNAARPDDVTSGYMTDGGLSLYTRRLNRLPDGMAAVRETLQRNTSTGQGDADSWDDSSSVSSGVSDTIDTDDINTSSSISSYANTPAAQRKPVTDAEKHSASTTLNPAWSGDEVKRSDGVSDSEVSRMDQGSKWARRNPSDVSDESDKVGSGRKTPSMTHTGSWKGGMSAQVGVTSPRTKATGTSGSAVMKTHSTGKTDDVKVSEKGRLSPRSNGLRRSPSDAGRSSDDESHALTSRTPTSTFGFKKQSSGMVTMVTASGATITSGSATLGKMPKSGTRSLAVGIKVGGQDVGSGLGHHDDGYLQVSTRSTLQYRSLPRPSRSGAGARNGNRSSTSSIEAAVLSVTTHSKSRDVGNTGKMNGSGTGVSLANQTDREKGVSEGVDNLRGGASTVPLTGRQQVASPTLRRLFGGKSSKQVPVTTAENMKNSTVISNPHATHAALDSPGGVGGESEGSSPLYGGRNLSTGHNTASSPGSVYSSMGPSNSLTWGTTMSTGSSAQSREGAGSLGYPSVSSMHTSSESIDMSVSSAGHGGRDSREDTLSALGRTSSIKTGMSESPLSSPSCLCVIRKLRRELDASQEKVSALTTQLSANAHLVAAFEQSLGNMTIRLKSLSMTAEHKDCELNELRKNIELLKKQNNVAQAAINGVINTPELTCKQNRTDLRMRRQHSSDSVSSVASATSHSSVGSNMDADAKNKKKNKKNWVCTFLRSSFKQAFSKKKSPKSASSHSDIEEMTDSSLPSSPKLPHNGSTTSSHMLRNSHSNSLLSDCLDGEAETVMQLRSELREKEMKLTDIRLEALSSAHQLDQLREAMNHMQGEIEKLKAENDRLKLESTGSSRAPSQASISSSTPHHTHILAPGPGLSQHSINLTESTSLDMLLDDTVGDGVMRKEGRHVKIVVSLDEDLSQEARARHFLIGCIGVSGKTKWDVLDGVVRRLFKEYITHVDPVSQLGLTCDSVEGYNIGDVHRHSNTGVAHTPELLPCGYLVGDSDTINIRLKGMSAESVDCLVFDTLIPKPMLQRYVSLLREHRRVILSGPSGTGKTHLANHLARHLLLQEGRPLTPHSVVTFNVDHKSSKELRQYLSGLAEQCSGDGLEAESPLVVILDNLHHVSSLGEIFNRVFNCKYQCCPYIIGTMSQATSSAPNLQLHHNFRWVLCANHLEPVKGFLGRYLRRKLIETEIGSRKRVLELVKIIDWIPRVWHHLNRFLEAHSSSDVTIGPRLFLSCPMDIAGSRVWFTDLWNYSIIPYMLEAIREGLQLYGRRSAWEDPARWVIDSYPWSATPTPADWPPLLQLRPEDVGFDGYSAPREGIRKEPSQSDSDADPLMNMLMRLKEAATSSSPQRCDSDSNSNSRQHDILDSTLESTL
uniref:Neuron navigator 3 n=1 Tax=Salmo trutta TaxID=8032 RepID=A0A673WKZ3_SALTR